MSDRYLEQNQARTREPSPYELTLARAIEDVFGRGHHDLDALVDGLNNARVHSPGGTPWTTESFITEIKRLAAI